MDLSTPLRSVLSPLGLELYDVEFVAGTLNVIVTRPGGVDLETLTSANKAISSWLDQNDPISGRFTLDVSTPGLERKLRTPEHFASAVGEIVTLRERRDGEPTRRLEGVALSSDGSSITLDDRDLGQVTVPLAAIERARTVFVWGAETPIPKRQKAAQQAKKG